MGRSSSTSYKYSAVDRFLRRICSKFGDCKPVINVITVTFLFTMVHECIDRNWKVEIGKMVRTFTSAFSRDGRGTPWMETGSDKELLHMFITGVKKCKRWVKEEEEILPISIPQLLVIIISAFPERFNELGYLGNGRPSHEFLARCGTVSTLVLLSYGLRVGEILPRVQKNIPLRTRIKLPKIGTTRFRYRKSLKWVHLSDHKTKALQKAFLRNVIDTPTAMMALSVKKTKPGRDRDIVFTHFHWKGFRILCPICTLCALLFHRLWFNNRTLKENDLLYVYSRRNRSHALTYDLLRTTILKITHVTGLYHCKIHEIKHGVLQDMWSSKLNRICEKFEIDLPTYLAVADHKPDYSQDYIKPNPLQVNALVKHVQYGILNSFFNSLTRTARSDLLEQIHGLCPRAPPKPQPQSTDQEHQHRSALQVGQYIFT